MLGLMQASEKTNAGPSTPLKYASLRMTDLWWGAGVGDLEPLVNHLSVPKHWSRKQQGVDAIQHSAVTG
jgi:hypothetical protein